MDQLVRIVIRELAGRLCAENEPVEIARLARRVKRLFPSYRKLRVAEMVIHECAKLGGRVAWPCPANAFGEPGARTDRREAA